MGNMRCYGCLSKEARFLSRHNDYLLPVCSEICSSRYCALVFGGGNDEQPMLIQLKRSADGPDGSPKKKKASTTDTCVWFKDIEVDYNRLVGSGSNGAVFPCRIRSGNQYAAAGNWDLVLRITEPVPETGYVPAMDDNLRMILSSEQVQQFLGPELGRSHLMVSIRWGVCKIPSDMRSRVPPARNLHWWPPQTGDRHFMEVMPVMMGDVARWIALEARGNHLTPALNKHFQKPTLDDARLLRDTLDIRVAILVQMSAVVCAMHTICLFHHKDLYPRNILWRYRRVTEAQRRVFWWKKEGFALETNVPYVFQMSDYDLSDFGGEGPEDEHSAREHVAIELHQLAETLSLLEWLNPTQETSHLLPVRPVHGFNVRGGRENKAFPPRLDILYYLRQRLPNVSITPELQRAAAEKQLHLIPLPETTIPMFLEIADIHSQPTTPLPPPLSPPSSGSAAGSSPPASPSSSSSSSYGN
jgi:hypothetical protein